MPHISSALQNLGVVFEESILSRSPELVYADPEVALYLFSGTKNEQKNTQNNLIEV